MSCTSGQCDVDAEAVVAEGADDYVYASALLAALLELESCFNQLWCARNVIFRDDNQIRDNVVRLRSLTGDAKRAMAGFKFFQQVRAAADTDQALTGLPVIDGVTLIESDRLLLVGQTDPVENGPYIVSAGAWQRLDPFVTDYELTGNYFWFVTEGDTYARAGFALGVTNPSSPLVIDTDALTIPVYYAQPNQSLTADQIAALAGTTGTPDAANRFVTETDPNVLPFVGSTALADGGQGIVPAPPASALCLYLCSDGTWQTPAFVAGASFLSKTGDDTVDGAFTYDWSGSIHKNAADPVDPQDLATMAYVDLFAAAVVPLIDWKNDLDSLTGFIKCDGAGNYSASENVVEMPTAAGAANEALSSLAADRTAKALGDADGVTGVGRAAVGTMVATDEAGFAHRDNANATDYAVNQNAAGDTSVNAKTGQSLFLRIANAVKATLTSTLMSFASGVSVQTVNGKFGATLVDASASDKLFTGNDERTGPPSNTEVFSVDRDGDITGNDFLVGGDLDLTGGAQDVLMQTWLGDLDVGADTFLLHDNSASRAFGALIEEVIGAGGKYVSKATPSNSAYAEFSQDTTKYDKFIYVFVGIRSSTDGDYLRVRVGNGGVDSGASDYRVVGHSMLSPSTGSVGGSTGANGGYVSAWSYAQGYEYYETLGGSLTVDHAGDSAAYTRMIAKTTFGSTAAELVLWEGATSRNAAQVDDTIRFLYTTGNMYGTILQFGVPLAADFS